MDILENKQGIGIKGREMALVWHEKASRTALQTSSISHTHTLLVQTHNMTTVKEIAEQCRLRCLHKIYSSRHKNIMFLKSGITMLILNKDDIANSSLNSHVYWDTLYIICLRHSIPSQVRIIFLIQFRTKNTHNVVLDSN